MKERPILFSAPMVRAILEGRKTQTRRVVKFPKWASPDDGVEFSGLDDGPAMLCVETGCFADVACKYGKPRDRLWVKETWGKAKSCNVHEPFYRADGEVSGRQTAFSYHERETRWRPSIHMPRWASRITLEVTGVRVERLQEITEGDARDEGCDGSVMSARDQFCILWEKINGMTSWAANPWVWVVEFKRSEQMQAAT